MNDQKCVEVFSNYFDSIVKELNIPIDQNLLNGVSIFDNPIIAAVHKCKRLRVSLKLRKISKNMTFFSFYHVRPDKLLKFLQNIDSKKATQQGDIPVRIREEL